MWNDGEPVYITCWDDVVVLMGAVLCVGVVGGEGGWVVLLPGCDGKQLLVPGRLQAKREIYLPLYLYLHLFLSLSLSLSLCESICLSIY